MAIVNEHFPVKVADHGHNFPSSVYMLIVLCQVEKECQGSLGFLLSPILLLLIKDP